MQTATAISNNTEFLKFSVMTRKCLFFIWKYMYTPISYLDQCLLWILQMYKRSCMLQPINFYLISIPYIYSKYSN